MMADKIDIFSLKLDQLSAQFNKTDTKVSELSVKILDPEAGLIARIRDIEDASSKVDSIQKLIENLGKEFVKKFDEFSEVLDTNSKSLENRISSTNLRVSTLEKHKSFAMGFIKAVMILGGLALSVAGLINCSDKHKEEIKSSDITIQSPN